jgi:predicted enzyme related to lactoylglutathione lyase
MSSMRSAILNITLDCTDAGRVARFWAEVTGWPLHQEDQQPSHEEYITGLGASVSGAQPPDAGWVVMADPEGNEFCLEPGAG